MRISDWSSDVCSSDLRQFGTEDQGWVAHFLISALEDRPITVYGDGKQVRDILYVSDAVSAYLLAQARMGRLQGRVFNLGGGGSEERRVGEGGVGTCRSGVAPYA